MLKGLFFVASGGALGASSRYLLATFVQSGLSSKFPFGTFAVNLLGCFLMGIAFGLSKQTWFSSSFHLLFAVGFLGSFTTFSSFALDNFHLVQQKQYISLVGNLFLQNVVGMFLVFAGFFVVR